MVCFCVPGFAQTPPFYQLTDENGLPHNTVYDIMQDHRGFLWANTEDGLVRYDGAKFTKYTTPKAAGKSGSLLQEDKNGTIWYRDFSGNLLFVAETTNKVEIYKPIQDLHQKNQFIFSFVADKLFMTTDTASQMYVLDHKTNQHRNIQTQQDFGKPIRALAKINEASLLVGGRDFFAILNTQTAQIMDFERPKNLMIRKFFYLKSTKEYLVFDDQTHKILKLDLTNKTFSEHKLSAFSKDFTAISNIQNDAQNPDCIWLTGDKGLYYIERKGEQYQTKFYFNTHVTDIEQDKEGQVWVSSYEDGIFCFPAINAKHFNTQNSVLYKNDVTNITHDAEGNFYFSNKTFPMVYQSQANQYNLTNWWQTPSLPINSLHFNTFQNALNLLCNNKNIVSLKAKKATTTDIGIQMADIKPMPFGYICRIGIKLSVFFTNSVSQKDFETKIIRAKKMGSEATPALDIRFSRFNDVAYNAVSPCLWAAFVDGLYYYKNNKTHILKYKNTTIYAQKLAQSHDTLLVGTKENGFFILKDTTIVQHFTTENGLLSNAIRDIELYDGSVWVAHNKGIQSYDIASKKWQNITKADGLLSYDIQDLDVAYGQIWVATPKGLFLFSTENKNYQNAIKPNVFITAINEKDTLSPHTQIQYRYGSDNILKIDFQGLALRSKGEYAYRYRIAGIDAAWQTAAPDRSFAIYPALPIGEHLFEVQIFNEDGVVSEPATVRIFVSRDWWALLPFMLLTLLISGVIFGIIYYNRQQKDALLLKNAEMKGDLISSKLAALRTQMNPHFIFNALASIQEFMLFNKPQLANDYLTQFADLMRHTLNISQEKNIFLAQELEVLNLYINLEAIRFKTNFEWKINIANTINPDAIQLPSMLLQPFVENAFKHGLLHKTEGVKQLTIDFDQPNPNILRCTITDNGIGRTAVKVMQARQRKHKSFAVSATQHRIQLLNEQQKQSNLITVEYEDLEENGIAKGTIVRVWIPIVTTKIAE
jgi:ligand-binding sensor domain-containing protein